MFSSFLYINLMKDRIVYIFDEVILNKLDIYTEVAYEHFSAIT